MDDQWKDRPAFFSNQMDIIIIALVVMDSGKKYVGISETLVNKHSQSNSHKAVLLNEMSESSRLTTVLTPADKKVKQPFTDSDSHFQLT